MKVIVDNRAATLGSEYSFESINLIGFRRIVWVYDLHKDNVTRQYWAVAIESCTFPDATPLERLIWDLDSID